MILNCFVLNVDGRVNEIRFMILARVTPGFDRRTVPEKLYVSANANGSQRPLMMNLSGIFSEKSGSGTGNLLTQNKQIKQINKKVNK